MAGLRLTHPGLQPVILHRLSWTCPALQAGWRAHADAWPQPVPPPFQAFWSRARFSLQVLLRRAFADRAWPLPVVPLFAVRASPGQAVLRFSVRAWPERVAPLSPVRAWPGPVAPLSPVRRVWLALQRSWARPVSALRLRAQARAFSPQGWPWAQQGRASRFSPWFSAWQPWASRPAWRLSAWAQVSHSPTAISWAWKTNLPATRPRQRPAQHADCFRSCSRSAESRRQRV